jgi:hypothetical protein
VLVHQARRDEVVDSPVEAGRRDVGQLEPIVDAARPRAGQHLRRQVDAVDPGDATASEPRAGPAGSTPEIGGARGGGPRDRLGPRAGRYPSRPRPSPRTTGTTRSSPRARRRLDSRADRTWRIRALDGSPWILTIRGPRSRHEDRAASGGADVTMANAPPHAVPRPGGCYVRYVPYALDLTDASPV